MDDIQQDRSATHRRTRQASMGLVVALALIAVVAGACAADPSTTESQAVTRVIPRDERLQAWLEVHGEAALRSAAIGLAEAAARTGPVAPERLSVPAAAIDQVRASIDAIRQRPIIEGHTLSALVVDLESGQEIFAEQPNALLEPASNTKMFTSAAALTLLGEDYRFVTRVIATAEPNARGVLEGDLYLVGEHDFTWHADFYNGPRVPLNDLAKQVADAGIKRVKGRVVAAGEFLYDGFRYDTYQPAHHRKKALLAFRSALNNEGVTTVHAEPQEGFTVPKGKVIAEWHSVPLGVACAPLNRVSHNEFADSLSRHMGWKMRGESSYEAGAKAVIAWMSSVGIDTTGTALHDGSGLSHDNRVSARHVVSLIQTMMRSPVGETWLRGMSMAGVNGTFAGRLRGESTKGRIWAKSGTLDGALAISGVLVNAHDGRRYAFSFLMNKVDSRDGGRRALDAMVRTFAGDLLGAGERPEAPVLQRVTGDGAKGTVTLQWTASEGASVYRVWLSEDGHVWSPEAARHSATTTLVLRDREAGASYVRVTALNAAGESDASDVYGVRVGSGRGVVLVVDANDRWADEQSDENWTGAGHAFSALVGEAMGEVSYDSAADEAVADGLVELGAYQAVFWSTGEESQAELVMPQAQTLAMEEYLTSGGALLLSGSEIGFSLAEGGSARASWMRDVLKTELVDDDAGTYLVRGVGAPFEGLPPMGFQMPIGMNVSVPDALASVDGARACLRYVGRGRGSAAIAYDGAYKLVYLGFPLAAIETRADRAVVTAAVLGFFGVSMADAPH